MILTIIPLIFHKIPLIFHNEKEKFMKFIIMKFLFRLTVNTILISLAPTSIIRISFPFHFYPQVSRC